MSAEPVAPAPPYADVMPGEVVLHLPRHEPWTWDDLQVIPDEEHHHYELIEGQLVVSPSPNLLHQKVVGELFMLLRSAAPGECEVVLSPFDFVPEQFTTLQPDPLVLRRGTAEAARTIVPPVLALELDAGGEYREVAHVSGPETFAAGEPFAVEIVPARLVED